MYIPCKCNVLAYRVFRNFCCKNLTFSKKKKQKKSCRLMNKERQKQTWELFHIFLCYRFFRTCIFTFIADISFLGSTHLLPTFPFYIPQKHTKRTCSLVPPEGINWEHHQSNEIIIDWPKYNQYLHSMPPGNIRKPKAFRHFQGNTKPEDR